MDKWQWKEAYRLMRLWRHGHITEMDYWNYLIAADLQKNHIQVMRVFSWRSSLYSEDATQKSQRLISFRLMCIKGRIEYEEEKADIREWVENCT